MKLLFWNLGYARGIDGSASQIVRRSGRLVRHSRSEQQKVLDGVTALVQREGPELFAYAEVLTGARRNGRLDQHVYIESMLSCTAAHVENKYSSRTLSKLPLHVGNSNGVCAMQPIATTALHFSRGGKTLVLKVETESCTVFVVHLAVISSIRRVQLRELASFVAPVEGDVIVCGDLNIFRGEVELAAFTRDTGCVLALPGSPTFPAHAPRRTLDGFLVRSGKPKKHRTYTIDSMLSDHLPVVLEF